jgi:hypothetical protein
MNTNLTEKYYVTSEYNVHAKLREADGTIQCSSVQFSAVILCYVIIFILEREPLPWQNNTSESKRFPWLGNTLKIIFSSALKFDLS